MHRFFALLVLLPGSVRALAADATATQKLRRTLSRSRSLIVEVTQPDPATAWALDVTEASARLRDAGATALLVPPALLASVIEEQASAKGSFPEPLPVFCALDGGDELGAASGAAGVAVRHASEGGASYAPGFSELADAAQEAGLPLIVIAEDEAAHAAAAAAGAVAVACDYPVGSWTSVSEIGGDEGVGPAPVALGAWGGDGDEMYALREAGFEGQLLIDGCLGDIGANAPWCESRVKLFKSKASRQWGGSMFGATSDDSTPATRNPRLWAQSQRQAREMMHESAKSRDLPAPKLKRNTVL